MLVVNYYLIGIFTVFGPIGICITDHMMKFHFYVYIEHFSTSILELVPGVQVFPRQQKKLSGQFKAKKLQNLSILVLAVKFKTFTCCK